MPARLAGYPATAITCLGESGYVPHQHRRTDTPETIDPEATERAESFVCELVRLLDRDLGRASGPRRGKRAPAATG
jgi:hypothetical protein